MAYYGEQERRRYNESFGYEQQPCRNTACNNVKANSYPQLPQGQIVRVCSKANPDYALGVRDNRQWVKEESWSNRVRDQVGHPAFCLINKATAQALRRALGVSQEVLMTNYEGGSYDENVLWTESEDMGCGYKTVRMANNIDLNLDAFQGDRKYRGIAEGTRAVLWKWNKQDNRLWKITPCY